VQQRSRQVLEAIVRDMKAAVVERPQPAQGEPQLDSADVGSEGEVKGKPESAVDVTAKLTPTEPCLGLELIVFEEASHWSHLLQSEILVAQLVAITPLVMSDTVSSTATAAAAATTAAVVVVAASVAASVTATTLVHVASVAVAASVLATAGISTVDMPLVG
jgi:hypothetical protein